MGFFSYPFTTAIEAIVCLQLGREKAHGTTTRRLKCEIHIKINYTGNRLSIYLAIISLPGVQEDISSIFLRVYLIFFPISSIDSCEKNLLHLHLYQVFV